MQIVVSLMALEYGLLTEPVFVAIIFGAVLSSVALGPWMTWALNRRRHGREFLLRDALLRLTASSRDEAIAELCTLAAHHAGRADVGELARIATARENSMSTAMEYGVAIPHGRIPGLREAVVVFGRSSEGIEWNAPDGAPARLIFLVLTAPDDPSQLQILRSIALAVRNPSVRSALLEASDLRSLLNVLGNALAPDPAATPSEPRVADK
jgi:mannitol/fructose-specific phosphotransferase system IIA component (Ntr-type)